MAYPTACLRRNLGVGSRLSMPSALIVRPLTTGKCPFVQLSVRFKRRCQSGMQITLRLSWPFHLHSSRLRG